MDGICSAILNKIYALGTPGRYFVISTDEFFENFPEDGKRDETQLKNALKSLSDEGYIDVKYSSGSMYCVTLLKQYVEEEVIPLPDEDDGFDDLYEPQITVKYANVWTFWSAFAGGAIGSAIICALALIVQYVK